MASCSNVLNDMYALCMYKRTPCKQRQIRSHRVSMEDPGVWHSLTCSVYLLLLVRPTEWSTPRDVFTPYVISISVRTSPSNATFVCWNPYLFTDTFIPEGSRKVQYGVNRTTPPITQTAVIAYFYGYYLDGVARVRPVWVEPSTGRRAHRPHNHPASAVHSMPGQEPCPDANSQACVRPTWVFVIHHTCILPHLGALPKH